METGRNAWVQMNFSRAPPASHPLQGVFSLGKMPCWLSLYMLGAFFALEIEGTEIGGL